MKTSSIPTYIFYFPYKGVGGVPVLFLRLAEYIANTYSVPSYVIDYNDGFMALNKKNPLITLIPYEVDKTIIVPDASIIIFQSDLPWGIPQNIQTGNNTKTFFWNCYPFNLIPVFPSPIKEFTSKSLIMTKFVLNTVLLLSKLRMKSLLHKMLYHKSISFMDGPNLATTEYCLGDRITHPQLLPILIKTPATKSISSVKNSETLVLCWVGRVADFKVHILNRVLEDACDYAHNKKVKIEFLIVGSGNEDENLFQNEKNSPYFKITKVPYLSESELDTLLTEKVNCLFAMGTSALEGAKLSTPTVLLNFSYSKVKPGYKYNFLFEVENFSLGEIITSKNYKQGHSFEKIISSLNENIGEKCYEYFSKNHTLEKNFELFLNQTKASQLQYNDLIANTNLEKPYFYKLWALIKKLY